MLARLQSRRGGGAAPAPFPPAMYASALASLNHLDYYITYALEAFGELNAFATNIEQHGAHRLEEKLAELMSLGVRPGTADDVPPFVLAAAATVRLSAGAAPLLLRFFLVPSSATRRRPPSAGSTRTSARSGSISSTARCGTACTAPSASGRQRSCRRRSDDRDVFKSMLTVSRSPPPPPRPPRPPPPRPRPPRRGGP